MLGSDPAPFPESPAHTLCVVAIVLTDDHSEVGTCHCKLVWLWETVPSGGLTVVESVATE